jgi:hypothetical protein
VSHSKERKEKACLNCGAATYGRYCHICGQENIETKESFWHLVTHFIEDVTHFDGKFFSTLKYLLFRPGFLTTEYLRGKRASYLHPIRMYVFTSAMFFISFFFVFHPEEIIKESNKELENLSAAEIKEQLIADKALKEKSINSLGLKAAQKEQIQKKIELINNDLDSLAKDTTRLKERLHYFTEQKNNFIDLGNYRSVKEYDSIQNTIPNAQKRNWLTHSIERKAAKLNEKYPNEASSRLIEVFFHKLPQILFISLPLFAAILHLLYIRRKKYYVEHGIFSIHLYIATFILMLLMIISNSTLPEKIDSWIKTILSISIFIYLYKAMRNFYQQSRIKTLLKLFLLNFIMFFVVVILFVSFFLLSFFTI